MSFSDFIIYADESGSPVLSADRDDFPIFVLVFLLVRKEDYVTRVVPAMQRLKFDTVGHDQLIFHERDIRRQARDFAFLQVDPTRRTAFVERLNTLVAEAPVELCCAIIDKVELANRYREPWDPYALALTFCMEKAAALIHKAGERGTEVPVIFEARGPREDRRLSEEFDRIANGQPRIGNASKRVAALRWRPRFADKRCNSTGLQMADLTARPLGLAHLKPDQPNRAAQIAQTKVPYPRVKLFP